MNAAQTQETSLDEKTKIRLFPLIAAICSSGVLLVTFASWLTIVSVKAENAEAYNVKQDLEINKKNEKQDAEIEELKKLAISINNNLIEMKAMMKERH